MLCLCLCHAPRERVSWNLLILLDVGAAIVTLHVSVWVEIWPCFGLNHLLPSRSTWACELKWPTQVWHLFHLVTLHVSVWVEMTCLPRHFSNFSVTLHVSVWVEMQICSAAFRKPFVTLHVSVWVEMTTWKSWQIFSARSRSTWACELKWPHGRVGRYSQRGHAPRERVSWNLCLLCSPWLIPRHAPRERVSWNIYFLIVTL